MTTTNGAFGIPQQGILASNATDTIKLTAASAGAVSINFSHPAGPGTAGPTFQLQLLDALGNVLVDKLANGNMVLETTIAASGEYFLKLIDPSAGGGGPGAYSISAGLSLKAGTTYDGGANNALNSAIATTLGSPITGSLTSADTDVFKVTAAAGGVVTLDFVHPEGPGTEGKQIAIELLDAAGNSIIKTTTAGNTMLTSTVAAAGDYYVKVSDGNAYQPGDGGLYTLTPRIAAGAGAATYDGAANNNTATAIPTNMGTPIVGSLNSSDTDVFKLRADAGGVLTLDFVHPDGSGSEGEQIAIELLDASGNIVIKTTTSGNTVLKTTIAAAGDYFVKVLDGNTYQPGDGGIYQLTPSLVTSNAATYDGAVNNSTATAITSAFGTQIVGSLNPSDTDVFKLQAKAGGVVTLDFIHPDGPGKEGEQVGIQLLDAAGNLIIETTVAGNTTLKTAVATAGDYYVRVLDGNTYQPGDGGIYKLTANLLTVPGVVYDGAANNSAATALKMTLPGAATGSLNNADSDFFSFSASSGGSMSINLSHPNGVGVGVPIEVTVTDAKGANVITKTLNGSDMFNAILPSAGEYTLKVADGNSYNHSDGGIYTVMLGQVGNGGSALNGSALSDSLSSTAGNDVINGAGGFDTVNYSGKAGDFRIAITDAGVQVVDSTGTQGSDTLFNIERLQFNDLTVSLDLNGQAAQAYRVYRAAFDRGADDAGLGYWVKQMEAGVSLSSIAQAFIDSKEFQESYGANPSHRDMVAQFYTNVLHRAPDSDGLDFWVNALDSGAIDAAAALVGFSESAENVAQLISVNSQGIFYQEWV